MWLPRGRTCPFSAALALSLLGLGLGFSPISLRSVPAESAQSITPGIGALDEFDTIQSLPTVEGGKQRLILGDVHGFAHVYEHRGQSHEEVWVSDFLEGAIGGLFVTDIDDDGLDEIIVYTDQGRVHFLDIADYTTIWSNPPGEYGLITAMIAHNVDDDPQRELILCADGRLIIYDGRDQFEEWRSEQSNMEAVDILVADVDGDGTDEIVLSDGFVFDARYRDLEWQSPEPFGEQLGALDLDADGIPEIVGQFGGRFLRVFDIDLRRMKAARK